MKTPLALVINIPALTMEKETHPPGQIGKHDHDSEASTTVSGPFEDLTKSPDHPPRNSYLVSVFVPVPHASLVCMTDFQQRVFMYNDTIGWITTVLGIICMVAAGVLLPVMNFVFGKFVTVFNDFIIGKKSPEDFRSSINHYT